MKESVAPATSMAEALSRTKRAVAGTFAFSLICGFVIELDIHNNLQYAQTDLTGLFGIIAAVAMLAVLLVAKPRKANIDYITPITALCLVTILLYRSLNVADGHVAGSLMTAFLISFYVLLWLMFISEANERKLPAFFLLGLALGVARLSVALGRFAAQTLLEQTGVDPQLALVGSVWLLVATLALMFCSYLRYASKRDAAGDAGAPEEAAGAPLAHLSAGDALVQMKSTYELTNREFEVIGVCGGTQRPGHRRAFHAVGAHGEDPPASRLREDGRALAPGIARPHRGDERRQEELALFVDNPIAGGNAVARTKPATNQQSNECFT